MCCDFLSYNEQDGVTEKFCGKGFFGSYLGECLNKIIACDFDVSIRLVPGLFASAPEKDLKLDWVKVIDYAGDLFHKNVQSKTFYEKLNGTLNGNVCCSDRIH